MRTSVGNISFICFMKFVLIAAICIGNTLCNKIAAQSKTLSFSVSEMKDTVLVSQWMTAGLELLEKAPDSAEVHFTKAAALCSKNLSKSDKNIAATRLFTKLLAKSLNNIGGANYMKKDWEKSVRYYRLAVLQYDLIQDTVAIEEPFNNMLHVYMGMIPPKNSIDSLSIFLDQSLKNQQLKRAAVFYRILAGIYKGSGKLFKAIENFKSGIKLCEKTGDEKSMGMLQNDLGIFYFEQGDIQNALNIFHSLLMQSEKTGNQIDIASSLSNLGLIYRNQGDIEKAIEYYNRALDVYNKTGNEVGKAMIFHNLGVACQKKGEPDSATAFFSLALKQFEKTNNIKGVSLTLHNIGLNYANKGDIKQAMQFYQKALAIRRQINDRAGLVHSLNSIGALFIDEKNSGAALVKLNESMLIANELGSPELIKNCALELSQLYKMNGSHRLSLENYELYICMRDSINNESTRKASIKSQLKYEYEKQAAADSVAHAKESEVKNVQLEKQKVEIAAKKNQQYALFGGLGLVIIFAGFMYNRFKITQKQKQIIEHQKKVVEEQKSLVEDRQKEILDSIRYAKRIQTALLPHENKILAILNKLQKK